MLHFACESVHADGSSSIQALRVDPAHLVIAGWTGRDSAAIEHHIAELAQLGVPRPSRVPLYYRASAGLLTQAPRIEVLGPDSSGEAEPVLFFTAGEWWLTVGSDHTDRRVETYSVAVSKQACAKPLATGAWRWRDVAAHQDELLLRSRIFEGDTWVLYQEGSFASIKPLVALRDEHFTPGGSDLEGVFLSCGTLATRPGADGVTVRPARQMEIEIADPRRSRWITHRYGVADLPIIV